MTRSSLSQPFMALCLHRLRDYITSSLGGSRPNVLSCLFFESSDTLLLNHLYCCLPLDVVRLDSSETWRSDES
jgi:hypothetical protein